MACDKPARRSQDSRPRRSRTAETACAAQTLRNLLCRGSLVALTAAVPILPRQVEAQTCTITSGRIALTSGTCSAAPGSALSATGTGAAVSATNVGTVIDLTPGATVTTATPIRGVDMINGGAVLLGINTPITVNSTVTTTGIVGINTQDFALQEGMGVVVDRSKEHLGTTDRAIITLRQILLESLDSLERGEGLRAIDPATYRNVRSIDRMVEATLDWRLATKADFVAKF